MKLQDIEKKFPPFDKPSGEAAYLLDTGKFVQYVEPTLEIKPNLVWAVKPGPRVEDYEYPPFIRYGCTKCGQAAMVSGPNATAQHVRHCGLVEPVPVHIAAQFKEMRGKYLARSKRKPVQEQLKFNDPTNPGKFGDAKDQRRDQLIADSLGYKPREVLIAEVQAHAASAKGR
jgi:hypothetical protein